MRFLFAGEGGQGVQAVAQILAKTAFDQRLEVSYIPNFGVEQRGGVSLAFVIIDTKPVIYPKFDQADIAIIFSVRSKKRIQSHLGKETKVILGPNLPGGLKTNLPTKVHNVVLLGETLRLSGILKPEQVIKTMEARFARQIAKKPALKELNRKALENERV